MKSENVEFYLKGFVIALAAVILTNSVRIDAEKDYEIALLRATRNFPTKGSLFCIVATNSSAGTTATITSIVVNEY